MGRSCVHGMTWVTCRHQQCLIRQCYSARAPTEEWGGITFRRNPTAPGESVVAKSRIDSVWPGISIGTLRGDETARRLVP